MLQQWFDSFCDAIVNTFNCWLDMPVSQQMLSIWLLVVIYLLVTLRNVLCDIREALEDRGDFNPADTFRVIMSEFHKARQSDLEMLQEMSEILKEAYTKEDYEDE